MISFMCVIERKMISHKLRIESEAEKGGKEGWKRWVPSDESQLNRDVSSAVPQLGDHRQWHGSACF